MDRNCTLGLATSSCPSRPRHVCWGSQLPQPRPPSTGLQRPSRVNMALVLRATPIVDPAEPQPQSVSTITPSHSCRATVTGLHYLAIALPSQHGGAVYTLFNSPARNRSWTPRPSGPPLNLSKKHRQHHWLGISPNMPLSQESEASRPPRAPEQTYRCYRPPPRARPSAPTVRRNSGCEHLPLGLDTRDDD